MSAQSLTVYDDVNPTDIYRAKGLSRPVYDHVDTSEGISKFLSRPVLVQTINWTGTFTTVSFNPWVDLAATTAYSEKLRNYNGIRAGVKLRFILNGTPFHYGRIVAYFVPLSYGKMRPNYETRITANPVKGGMYQVRHVVLDPTVSQPVEWSIPYEAPDDYAQFFINASEIANTFTTLGQLGKVVIAIDTPLQSVSAAVPEPVTIQVYAWYEDVILGPVTPILYTTGNPQLLPAQLSNLERVSNDLENSSYDVQGGEAVATGPVSRLASSVAKAASYLKSVPFIGAFASATEIGANAISGIASIFGYSVPTSIDRDQIVKGQMAGNFSFTTARDTGVKLTLDPLQEITVDPMALGCSDPRDQMTYKFLYSVPTLLTRFDWAVGTASGTRLFTMPVSPAFCPAANFSGAPRDMFPSPVGLLALCHRYWTGTLKYRIEVICSAYHKGRLQVRYIPNVPAQNLATALPGFGLPTSQTIVMDLAVDHKKEFEIGWSQPNALEELRGFSASNNANATSTDGNPGLNGYFTVEILTKLTAPVTVAPVTVLIFMEGTEDLHFMCPTNIFSSQVTIQAGQAELLSTGGEITSVHLGGPRRTPENLHKIFMGEKVGSVRALLKRFVPVGRFGNDTITAGNGGGPGYQQLISYYFLDYAVGDINNVTTNEKYFSTSLPNYFDIWKLCFLGVKGATRYKISTRKGTGTLSTSTLQLTEAFVARYKTQPKSLATPNNQNSVEQLCSEGFAYFNPSSQFVEFEIPDYSKERFRFTNSAYSYSPFDPVAKDAVALVEYVNIDSTKVGEVIVTAFCAGGEDFSLLNFYCCPKLLCPSAFNMTLTLV